MKIFITGGTGFIGAHLLRILQQTNHDMLCLVLDKEDISTNPVLTSDSVTRGNLSSPQSWIQSVEDFHPDVTIHLAWSGIPDYGARTSMTNLLNGLELLNALVHIGCPKIIGSGSCWEYGKTQGQLTEDMRPISSNAFTAAKNALHMMGSELARDHNFCFIWTRFFYVYGPGQRPYSLLPSIITSLQQGDEPTVKTPQARNDFIYVEDVAKALLAIAEKATQSTVYNIGSGQATSVHSIADRIYRHYHKVFDGSTSPSSQDVPNFWADILKLTTEIGWTPRTTLEEGIHKTIAYYQSLSMEMKEV